MSSAAERWARAELPVTDITLVRSRPWAQLHRLQTDVGVWWLKTNAAGTTYEPRLLGFLLRFRLEPGAAVPVPPRPAVGPDR